MDVCLRYSCVGLGVMKGRGWPQWPDPLFCFQAHCVDRPRSVCACWLIWPAALESSYVGSWPLSDLFFLHFPHPPYIQGFCKWAGKADTSGGQDTVLKVPACWGWYGSWGSSLSLPAGFHNPACCPVLAPCSLCQDWCRHACSFAPFALRCWAPLLIQVHSLDLLWKYL